MDVDEEFTHGGSTEQDEGETTATNEPGAEDEDSVTGEETGNHKATGASAACPSLPFFVRHVRGSMLCVPRRTSVAARSRRWKHFECESE